MNVKKLAAILLSAAFMVTILAGCNRKTTYSDSAAAALIAAQGSNVKITITTSPELDNALRLASQHGESADEVRSTLLKLLQLSSVDFSISGINSAKSGEHAVQVYRVSGNNTVPLAAASAAREIMAILSHLSGKYTGEVSMLRINGNYYIAVVIDIVAVGNTDSNSGSSSSEDQTVETTITAKPDPDYEDDVEVSIDDDSDKEESSTEPGESDNDDEEEESDNEGSGINIDTGWDADVEVGF